MDYEKYKKIDKYILKSIYLSLMIPLIIFLLFWYKLYISLPIIALLIYLYVRAIKSIKYKNKKEYCNIFNLKRWLLIIIAIVSLNIVSGSGGFMYQNWDYNARNAVMHDLIDYKWPVKYKYDKNDAIYEIIGEEGRLSYYFIYWLPSAAIGKITGFEIANKFLFIYQTILLIFFFYLLSRLFNKNSLWFLIIFFAFSGLDIIGSYIINKNYTFLLGSHIDTWGLPVAYSSNITQLFWVFNQSIPAWIITLLFLNAKSYKNIGILLVLSLAFSPFPTIGLVLLITYYLLIGFKNNRIIERLKDIFSKENLIAIIPFIIIALFYINNANSQPKGLLLNKGNYFKLMVIVMFFEFILLSILCINKKNYKYIIFNAICLIICSQFYLGSGSDFMNRTTIPLLLVLFIYCIDVLKKGKKGIQYTLIICYLCFSSITNVSEVYRSIENTKNNEINNISNLSDNWKTYGKTVHEDAMKTYIKNFSSPYKHNLIDKYIFR